MHNLTPALLKGFRDELRKVAMNPRLFSALGTSGALAGVGAVGGGLLGAGIKGVKGYRDARAQGASAGDALAHGVTGGLQGASKGALLGGTAGLVGGAALGAARPGMGNKLREAVDALPGAHVGQRQVHALTGWTPEKGIGSIGLGAAARKSLVEQAERDLATARASNTPTGRLAAFSEKIRGTPVERAEKSLRSAQRSYEAAQNIERMGLTNIPGYAKSLMKDPSGTLRAAASDQWHNTPTALKALTVAGAGSELLAAAKAQPEEGETKGMARGRALGRAAANTAGNFLLSPMPQLTQMVLGQGLTNVAGRAGQGVGSLLSGGSAGTLPNQQASTGANDQVVSAENSPQFSRRGSPL